MAQLVGQSPANPRVCGSSPGSLDSWPHFKVSLYNTKPQTSGILRGLYYYYYATYEDVSMGFLQFVNVTPVTVFVFVSSDQPTYLQAEGVLCTEAVQWLWVAQSGAREGEQGETILRWTLYKGSGVLGLWNQQTALATFARFSYQGINKRSFKPSQFKEDFTYS